MTAPVVAAIAAAVLVYAALLALYEWYAWRDRKAAKKRAISDRDKGE